MNWRYKMLSVVCCDNGMTYDKESPGLEIMMLIIRLLMSDTSKLLVVG